MEGEARFPVAVLASDVHFDPGAHAEHSCVESIFVVYCRTGRGCVEANGHCWSLERGVLLVLPWGVNVRYQADSSTPLGISGVHLIPSHSTSHPVSVGVAPDGHHELAGLPWRQNDDALPIRQTFAGSVSAYPHLIGLVRYAVRLFDDGSPPTELLRALGVLIVHELHSLASPRRALGEVDLPPDIEAVVAYVEANLHAVLRVRDLAEVGGYNEATLTRRFREVLGAPPMAWVIERRLRRATDLLRTTTLPIAKVGARCGFADPYYFSRAFRGRYGESPAQWRRRQGVI